MNEIKNYESSRGYEEIDASFSLQKFSNFQGERLLKNLMDKDWDNFFKKQQPQNIF